MITIGCTVEESIEIPQFEDSSVLLIEILSDDALITAKLPKPPIWADCHKYRAIVTPAKFKPESDPFDELYGGTMFANGFPLISDSKPGDQDYNGGRWHMNLLKVAVSQDKYKDACSLEDLDLDDFMSTDNYFECPLIRYK